MTTWCSKGQNLTFHLALDVKDGLIHYEFYKGGMNKVWNIEFVVQLSRKCSNGPDDNGR